MRESAHPNLPPPKTAVDLLLLDALEGLRNQTGIYKENEYDCCGNAWPPCHVCFLLTGARSAFCFLRDVVIYQRPSKLMGES